MKLAIAALVFVSSAAMANCQQDIESTFSTLRAESVRIADPSFSPYLAGATLRIGGLPDDEYGHTNSDTAVVSISEQTCALPAVIRDSIIAHEIGHIIANMTYPQMHGERRSRIVTFTNQQVEGLADQYGSHLMTPSSNNEILAISDEKCIAGDKWYCELRDSWQYGITH